MPSLFYLQCIDFRLCNALLSNGSKCLINADRRDLQVETLQLELQHLKEEQLEGSHKSRMNLNSQDAARDLIADITSTLTHRSTRIQQTPLVKSPPNYGQLGKLSAHSDELPATRTTVQQLEQGEQERQVRNKHTYTHATTCSQRTPVWVCGCVGERERESH